MLLRYYLLITYLAVGTLRGDDDEFEIIQNEDGSVEIIGEEELIDDGSNTDENYHEETTEHPSSLNWKVNNMMPKAVFQGAKCNICGWVTGVQALSSRVAIATENYQPWSIQNVILCNRNKFCSGTHQDKVPNMIAKNMDQIVLSDVSPLIKNKCNDYNNCTCKNATTSSEHSLLRDIQWFFLGPVLTAHTPEDAEQGLQSGPLTTCFLRKVSHWYKDGNSCANGCSHANSIVGYDETRWYLQESVGAKFKYPVKRKAHDGLRLRNGTWFAYRNSTCGEAILRKAKYPLVFFDYDKANAYFESETVKEDQLLLVHSTVKGVSPTTSSFTNSGMAKRNCSLTGINCLGVVKNSNGSFEVIKSIGKRKSKGANIVISRKKQMVFYIRHSSGKYVGIRFQTKKLSLVLRQRYAAPFFTSYSKIVSFKYPEFVIGNKAKLVVKNEYNNFWELKDANLKNNASGLSMTVNDEGSITGSVYDRNAISQRFDVGLSGAWKIKSKSKNLFLRKKKENDFKFQTSKGYSTSQYLRWQARQIITDKGKPFNSQWELSDGYFKLDEHDNHVVPTDTYIQDIFGGERLGVVNNRVKMVDDSDANADSRWTFEYDTL